MVFAIIFSAAVLYLVSRRLLFYLRFFQQQEYNAPRFLRWLALCRKPDWSSLAVCSVLLAVTSLIESQREVASLFGFLGLVVLAFLQEDPRTTGKLPLRTTARAKRIYLGALAASAAATFTLLCWLAPRSPALGWLAAALTVQAAPLFLTLAVVLLSPHERKVQRYYKMKAKRRLEECDPYSIGITGSYGKTSTKHILARMLKGIGPAFCPSGSINTEMGITRSIREELRTSHEFGVFEMGAYRIGSIKRLCDFVRPRAGIITNIGVMHLERFGSEENIFQAKSELARALPRDGVLVLNANDKNCMRLRNDVDVRTVLTYSTSEGGPGAGDYRAYDIRTEPTGTRFTIACKDGSILEAVTPLLGSAIISNVVASFAMAHWLGVDADYLLAVLRNLRPVPNRLEVQTVATDAGDVILVKDSYNSNPAGFRSALEVVRALPGSRRIVMTPGVVELGQAQYGENRSLGELVAGVCDIAITVGSVNKAALCEGLARGDRSIEVASFDTRATALDYLKETMTAGDIVLLENDLPDLYDYSSNSRRVA